MLNKTNRLARNEYHLSMTRLFIIILIALLPLRGWSADRMAIDMAAGELPSEVIGAGQHDSMPENCPIMFEAVASEAGVSPAGDEGERGCQACQLCMSLAPYEVLTVKAISFKSSAVDTPLVNCFVSADRVLALKPPIS